MMGAASLQPPKSGRSRFSKALPAPPSLPPLEFESQLDLAPLVPEKALPRVQPEAPLPPIPPPKGAAADRDTEPTMAAMAKPLNSPLPPVPPKFAGPPPMRSIPRRPVASPVTPMPGLAPATAPALASPDPSPSPVGSISSLLSAYSNHTDESPRSPSANLARDLVDSKSAYSVVSPSLGTQRSGAQSGARAYDLPPLPSEQNAPNHHPGCQAPKADQEELPPPPPLKDAQRSISRPQTPTGLPSHTAQPPTSTRVESPLRNGSPPQEQLWRRRSRSRSLKGEQTLVVPDLKLVSSHGSTAASAQDASQSSQTSLLSHPFPVPPKSNLGTSESATAPQAPPRSANRGLPGRNIRPVVPGEQAAPLEASMGQEMSRVKEKLQHGRNRGSAEERKTESHAPQVSQAAATPSPATSAAVSPVSAQRLPTPEYGTNDVKSPLPNTVVSPLSPASSPELPGEPKPITRKAVGGAQAQVRSVKSTPSLAPAPVNTGLGVRSPIGLPTSPRPGVSQGSSQTSLLPVSPAPEANQSAHQPQYRPYSPAPERSQSPSQKQYMPYSPPQDRDPAPNPPQPAAEPTSRGEEDQRSLPATHQELPAPQFNHQQNPWSQPPARDPLPRTVSETGSIETVKPSQPPPPTFTLQQPNPSTTALQDLPLREPDLNEPDTTTNPGAALFPRGWYPSQPADNIPEYPRRPLTQRHFECLTAHRYMTANRQRTNPLPCRTCGHVDRFAECYICSACSLNVCKGCVGVLRRLRGDLRAVLGEVQNLKKKEETGMQAGDMGGRDGVGVIWEEGEGEGEGGER